MYTCGWDGGGTRTSLCLLDGEGREIAAAVFGPLNPNGSTPETIRGTVRDCVAFMASQPGGLAACRGLVIGMAGVSSRPAAGLTETAVRESGYAGPLRILGDQEIALEGAVSGPGAVLIAGTGSVCFGRDAQGRTFRSGGWGWLIDDCGSGYAIGRDILTAAARAADGRGPETCLTEAVFRALKTPDLPGVISWLYRPDTGKKQIAALAPLLLPALEAGDAAARSIAGHAAEDLSLLAAAVWRRAGLEAGEIALSGGVLQHFPPIRQGLLDRLKVLLPRASVIEPRGTAAWGAARLARSL